MLTNPDVTSDEHIAKGKAGKGDPAKSKKSKPGNNQSK